MTLHVTIEKPLKAEVLAAHAAGEAIRIIVLLNKGSKSNYAVTTFRNLATTALRFDAIEFVMSQPRP